MMRSSSKAWLILDDILYVVFACGLFIWDTTHRLRHPIPHQWLIYWELVWPVKDFISTRIDILFYHLHTDTLRRRRDWIEKVKNGLKQRSKLKCWEIKKLLKLDLSKSQESANMRDIHLQNHSSIFNLPSDILLRIFREAFILNADGSSTVYILTGSEFDYYDDLQPTHPVWRNHAEYTLSHRKLIHRTSFPRSGWDETLIPQRRLHHSGVVRLNMTEESEKWTLKWRDQDPNCSHDKIPVASRVKLKARGKVRKLVRDCANRLTSGCQQSLGPYLPLLLVCKRMYPDAIDALYRSLDFRFSGTDSFLRFVSSTPSPLVTIMRPIRLKFPVHANHIPRFEGSTDFRVFVTSPQLEEKPGHLSRLYKRDSCFQLKDSRENHTVVKRPIRKPDTSLWESFCAAVPKIRPCINLLVYIDFDLKKMEDLIVAPLQKSEHESGIQYLYEIAFLLP